ncbi:MAG TPA: hypothetical protein VEB59_04895, partial [Gemmatimonadales bacterium]|nr:hypothetical protein [Gemmatimonadales bacterium]
MIGILAFRHLLVRRLRSLFLLTGFALGVGVMIVLLSVGEAMLDQSRDVELVGGGELTVLPLGIDIEAMRTGGLSGMFFGIDRARFLTRLGIGGPRYAEVIESVAPAIEGKLLYLCPARGDCTPTAVRAGAEIPSRAAAVGAALDVRGGRWADTPADSAYVAPTPGQLYDELDRFHLPPDPDSTWGEWHYFNLVTGPAEWWYVTYLVGGRVSPANLAGSSAGHRSGAGGRLLLTHRRPDGRHDRYTADVRGELVRFDTSGADLTLGRNAVIQREGVYRLDALASGPAGTVRLDLAVRPLPNRYFPPVELREEALLSGYVVPGLAASASGRVCLDTRCREIRDAPAYHDHNWGVWRDVTWEWGAAHGERISLLYGGVYQAGAVTSPFFLTLADSLGVRQVLRFGRIRYEGGLPADGMPGVSAPARFDLVAGRDADTVRLSVEVEHALATDMGASGFRRTFLQMRGRFTLRGRIGRESVADEGRGFF